MERKLGKVRSYLSKSLTSTYILVQSQIYMAEGPMATFSPLPHFQTPSGGAKLHNELSYKFKHQLRVYLWCLVRLQTRSFNLTWI